MNKKNNLHEENDADQMVQYERPENLEIKLRTCKKTIHPQSVIKVSNDN